MASRRIWVVASTAASLLALAGLAGLIWFLITQGRSNSDQWASIFSLILAYMVTAGSLVAWSWRRSVHRRTARDEAIEEETSSRRRQVWRVPPRNPHLVGRDSELDHLHSGFGRHTSMTVAAIRGLGGVGKTQLAMEYAHRYREHYDVVWWINAERPDLIVSQLEALGSALGLPPGPAEGYIDMVRESLHERPGWLLIFDNADDPTDIRPFVPDGRGHVLVTTRRAGFGALGGVIEIDVLSRSEAIALLCRRTAIAKSAAHQIASLVGDLPLALAQAAAYIEKTRISGTDYLQLLRTRAADMLGRGLVIGHPHTTATVWSLSADMVSAQHPAGWQILMLCSWLAPEPVPIDLFTRNASLLDGPLGEAATDRLALAEAVASLLDYSLARREDNSLVIHRLVQTMGREWNKNGKDTLGLALTILANDLPTEIIGLPGSWPRWTQLMPHVIAATTHHTADGERDSTLTLISLLCRTAVFLRTHSQPAPARAMAERALRLAEGMDESNPATIADALATLGLVLRDLGQPSEACPLQERALRLHQSIYGRTHAVCADDLNQIGLTLRDLGCFEEAQQAITQSLQIREAIYGTDHTTVGTALNHLAQILSLSGKPHAALPILQRALRLREQIFDVDHPEVASDLNQLGAVLTQLNRLEEAQLVLERAQRINEEFYGLDHPYLARVLVNLALTMRAMKKPSQAQRLLRRALVINQAVYGPEHPSVTSVLEICDQAGVDDQ